METAVDAKEFAKQLIADKCRTLIEAENMLPDKVMAMVKRAHQEYKDSPTDKNFNTIKELILQTKYVEESVEHKNFHRGTFLIAMNLIVKKCEGAFPAYGSFFARATRGLERLDPDIKSSPKDMLKHYYECIEELENPKADDHYMISYAKSVISKILYEAVADMTGGGTAVIPAATGAAATRRLALTKRRPAPPRVPPPPPRAPLLVRPLFEFA